MSLLISVPKKRFKHAVKRNRVKRQLREAFRLHKASLYQALEHSGKPGVVMAFIWIGDKLCDSSTVERRVANLLERLAEKLKQS